VRDAKLVGADHLRMVLTDGQSIWEAIAFRQASWLGALPKTIDVAYEFESREWNGEVRLQLNVKDIKPVNSGQ
jgi:hypothetical protein